MSVPLNPVIAEVTRRIVERSRDRRAIPLLALLAFTLAIAVFALIGSLAALVIVQREQRAVRVINGGHDGIARGVLIGMAGDFSHGPILMKVGL